MALNAAQFCEINSIEDAKLEEYLRDDSRRDALVEYFGEAEYDELRSLIDKPKHFAAGSDVILLPGIMGSELADRAGNLGKVWLDVIGIGLKDEFLALMLAPSGTQDSTPGIRLEASGLLRGSYYLTRLWLESRGHQVHEFPFDWRHDIDVLAGRLHEFVERLAGGDAQKKFVLVAHSMGGLVSRRYLDLKGDQARKRVEKLIMLGTPNHGSYAPPMAMTGQYPLLKYASLIIGGVETRSVVTTFPGLYQMFPHPEKFGQPELYKTGFWSGQFLREPHLERASEFQLQVKACLPEKMFLIACRKRKTITRVEREEDKGEVHYRYLGADVGDGTVPFQSAYLAGVTTYLTSAKHDEIQKDIAVLRAVDDLINNGDTGRLPLYQKPFADEEPTLAEIQPDECVFHL